MQCFKLSPDFDVANLQIPNNAPKHTSRFRYDPACLCTLSTADSQSLTATRSSALYLVAWLDRGSRQSSTCTGTHPMPDKKNHESSSPSHRSMGSCELRLFDRHALLRTWGRGCVPSRVSQRQPAPDRERAVRPPALHIITPAAPQIMHRALPQPHILPQDDSFRRTPDVGTGSWRVRADTRDKLRS